MNRFDLALQELDSLLKQTFEERLMLNMLHTSSCIIPGLIVEINRIKSMYSTFTEGDAVYAQIMVDISSSAILLIPNPSQM
jgi:hypothetical protein